MTVPPKAPEPSPIPVRAEDGKHGGSPAPIKPWTPPPPSPDGNGGGAGGKVC